MFFFGISGTGLNVKTAFPDPRPWYKIHCRDRTKKLDLSVMDFSLLLIPLCYITSSLAGVFGFGSSLLLTPVAMILLPPRQAIALVTVAFTVSTLSKTWLHWSQINWRISLWIMASSIPMSVVGALMMVHTDTQILKWVLATLVLFHVFREKFFSQFRLPPNNAVIFGGGVFYGLISGLVGTGSPVKVMVFSELNLVKEQFVGTMAVTALFMNIAKVGIYGSNALFSWGQWPLLVGMSLTALAGAWTGKVILKKMSVGQYKKGVWVLLIVSAAAMLWF